MKTVFTVLTTTLVLLGAAVAANAQEAGSVTFATGDVTAAREPPVELEKGSSILVSDIVITGDASRAQLLFIDDAKLAIRPNSRIVVEEYVHAEATAAPGAVISSSDDTSVIRLVKGGFRTITGAIGDENPQNYEVRTAVGVLGIRGTDFAVLFCNGDCAWAPGLAVGAAVPNGLYIMVTTGKTVFRNEVMSIDIDAGEFVFIPLDTRRPERLDAAPPVFIDTSDFRFDDPSGTGKAPADGQAARPGDADEPAPAGFDSTLGTRRVPDSSAPAADGSDGDSQDPDSQTDTPAQSIRGIDQNGTQIDLTPGDVPETPSPNRSISWSGGPLGQADTNFSAVLDNVDGQFQLDAAGDLAGFDGLYPGRSGSSLATFGIGTASNAETGSDGVTVLRWGRWAGGVADITLTDGTDVSQDLGSQSLHWIMSPEWASPPAMPTSGLASYSLVGSTSPTDGTGTTGVLLDASLQADFVNMLVDSTLAIDIAGLNWSAIGQGDIGSAAQLPAHLFQGSYNVTVTDPQGNTFLGIGQFSGFFSEPGPSSDPAFPGGAGLTYSLQDQGASLTISGAAAFGNP